MALKPIEAVIQLWTPASSINLPTEGSLLSVTTSKGSLPMRACNCWMTKAMNS